MDEDYWPPDETDGEPTAPAPGPRAGVPIPVPPQQGIPIASPAEFRPYSPGSLPAVPQPGTPIPINPHAVPVPVHQTPLPQVKPLAPEPAPDQGALPQTPQSAWAQPPQAVRPTPDLSAAWRGDAEAPSRPSGQPVAPTTGVAHQVPPAPVPRRQVEYVPPVQMAPGVVAVPQPPRQTPPDGTPVTRPDITPGAGAYPPPGEAYLASPHEAYPAPPHEAYPPSPSAAAYPADLPTAAYPAYTGPVSGPGASPVSRPGADPAHPTHGAPTLPPATATPAMTTPNTTTPGMTASAMAATPFQSPPASPAPPPRAFPAAAIGPGPTAGAAPEPGYMPTAEEFARRRAARPQDPVARMGIQASLRRGTFGLVNLSPGRREQEFRHDVELVRRNFGGLRQVTVVNPKGGAGKTVAVLMLAMTFGQRRGGYVLAWDNNETQGTLGMRAQQDFHTRTVRDLLRDLYVFQGAQGRVGDLSQYVRAQGEGMFEVLASDESATAGEMLTDVAFGEIRDVVSRFYKIIVVDTGNNVRAPNWQAAVDATDQLVVTMSARNDSAETAARMLDHLEQSGRTRLVRQAVTVLSLPQHQRELDAGAIERHFAARTRAVVPVPYERIIDTGEPIRYGQLSEATQDAWLKVAAAVSEGL